MRNYIHIMLCANLFAAQLLFVVGVERTENEVLNQRGQIMVVCRAIAAVEIRERWRKGGRGKE